MGDVLPSFVLRTPTRSQTIPALRIVHPDDARPDDDPSDSRPVQSTTFGSFASSASDPPALVGDLAQMPLSDLLQTSAAGGRTGQILIERGAQRGRLWLRDGRVVDAHADDLLGRDAVYTLVAWSDGRFAFHTGAVDVPDRIGESTSFLLLEAMRRLDESRRFGDPEHAGLPEEPPEPSREQQACHHALLLLNVAASWVRSGLEPALVVRRLDAARSDLRAEHPLLERFAIEADGPQIAFRTDAPDCTEAEVGPLVAAVGAWLRDFFARVERALPGHFGVDRLAVLTNAHRATLADLGFDAAIGWRVEVNPESTDAITGSSPEETP